MADAANSAGDLLIDAVVFYTIKEARKKATPERPWGRGKIEPLGALTIGGVLLATGGGKMLYNIIFVPALSFLTCSGAPCPALFCSVLCYTVLFCSVLACSGVFCAWLIDFIFLKARTDTYTQAHTRITLQTRTYTRTHPDAHTH